MPSVVKDNFTPTTPRSNGDQLIHKVNNVASKESIETSNAIQIPISKVNSVQLLAPNSPRSPRSPRASAPVKFENPEPSNDSPQTKKASNNEDKKIDKNPSIGNLRAYFSSPSSKSGFFKSTSSKNLSIKSSLSWDDFFKIKTHKEKKPEETPRGSSLRNEAEKSSRMSDTGEKVKEPERPLTERNKGSKIKRENNNNKGSKIKDKESAEDIKRSITPPTEDKKNNFPVLSPRFLRPMLSPRKASKEDEEMVLNEDPIVMLLEFFPNTFKEMITPILEHYVDPVEVAIYLVRRGWKLSSKGEKWLKFNLVAKKLTLDELRK